MAGQAWHLTFGDPQTLVLIGYAVAVPLLVGVFVVIAVQSRASIPFDRVQEHGYWLRRHWLAVLTAIGVWGVGLTFFGGMPYASGAPPAVVASVSGGQFYWSITPARFRLGARVRFDVTSLDVNHGFGVYDLHGHLIGSVQAMPGRHNELDLTLSEAGTYHVLCFEFCGLDHAPYAELVSGDEWLSSPSRSLPGRPSRESPCLRRCRGGESGSCMRARGLRCSRSWAWRDSRCACRRPR